MTPIRVLIIDDSAVIRTILSRVLGASADFQVCGCYDSVDDARASIVEQRPDVVTLDISMPGLDGLHYLEELRRTIHPAMVVVSASTTHGSAAEAEALARGADGCFDKARIVSASETFIATLKAAVLQRSRDEGTPAEERRPYLAKSGKLG